MGFPSIVEEAINSISNFYFRTDELRVRQIIDNRNYREFRSGKGVTRVLTTDDDYATYNSSFETIYCYVNREYEGVSRSYVIGMLEAELSDAGDIDQFRSIVSSFINQISEMPKRRYKCVRPLFGVMISEKVINIGNIKLISKDYIHEFFGNWFKDVSRYNGTDPFAYNDKYGYCYIEVSVEARENERATEDSDAEYTRIINTLHYMKPYNNPYNINIGRNGPFHIMYNHIDGISGNIVVIDQDNYVNVKFGSIRKMMDSPIDIDENGWILQGSNGNKRIWELMYTNSRNKFQSRLLDAIQWIGMAKSQSKISIAFIQCIFAIECILSDQDGSATKSITAQTSEYAAFILGSDVDSRMSVNKLFFYLYRLRSKVAHGNDADITTKDLYDAILSAEKIVKSLLTKPEFSGIKDIGDLRKIIEKMKFS